MKYRKPYSMILITLIAFCMLSGTLHAQEHQPVKWNFSAVPIGDNTARLSFTANLDEGWHIYSQFLKEDGPLPTTFKFESSGDYTLINKVKEESAAVKTFDSTFLMDIIWFKNPAIFTQSVKLYVPTTNIRGTIEFMACTEEMCLPPEIIRFNIPVRVEKPAKKQASLKSEK